MKKFHFEHEFQNATPRQVLDLFFDPAHDAEQDRLAEIDRRELLEEEDTADTLRRTYRVFPRRQLPAAIQPFLKSGPLSYVEKLVWKKKEDTIEFDITPSALGGRAHIVATYRVASVGQERVHRTYGGHVHVDVTLVGGRIEKGIIEELERSQARTARCTQEWLDRGSDPGRERSRAHGS